jgi:hypothetical protein
VPFQIEDNIPTPRSWAKYPFQEMGVGQSFFVPWDPKLAPSVNKLQSKLSSSARIVLGRGKVTTRIMDGGVRVWRIA